MLAKRYGICGNPLTGYPDRVFLDRNKVGWVRALVLELSNWQAMYDQMPDATNMAAVITGQSLGINNDFWSTGWADRFTAAVTEFCERFYKKVRLIEFVNEWDTWDNTDRVQKAAEIAIVGTNICKKYGILGVLGSVAGGDWKIELKKAIDTIKHAEMVSKRMLVHGFAFHPYASYVQRKGTNGFVVPSYDGNVPDGWEQLSDKIQAAIDIAGGMDGAGLTTRVCAITEMGIKVGDAGGEDNQGLWVHGAFQNEVAQFTPDQILMACLFCWADQNGAPWERGEAAFGMLREDGSLRPSYFSALFQCAAAPEADLPFQRLLDASLGIAHVPDGDGDDHGTTKVGLMTIEEAHKVRWQLINSSAVYNHTFGFERNWRKPENAWWGSPLHADEDTLVEYADDGTTETRRRPLRVFANAVVAYNPSDGTCEVLS